MTNNCKISQGFVVKESPASAREFLPVWVQIPRVYCSLIRRAAVYLHHPALHTSPRLKASTREKWKQKLHIWGFQWALQAGLPWQHSHHLQVSIRTALQPNKTPVCLWGGAISALQKARKHLPIFSLARTHTQVHILSHINNKKTNKSSARKHEEEKNTSLFHWRRFRWIALRV